MCEEFPSFLDYWKPRQFVCLSASQSSVFGVHDQECELTLPCKGKGEIGWIPLNLQLFAPGPDLRAFRTIRRAFLHVDHNSCDSERQLRTSRYFSVSTNSESCRDCQFVHNPGIIQAVEKLQ